MKQGMPVMPRETRTIEVTTPRLKKLLVLRIKQVVRVRQLQEGLTRKINTRKATSISWWSQQVKKIRQNVFRIRQWKRIQNWINSWKRSRSWSFTVFRLNYKRSRLQKHLFNKIWMKVTENKLKEISRKVYKSERHSHRGFPIQKKVTLDPGRTYLEYCLRVIFMKLIWIIVYLNKMKIYHIYPR